MLDLIILHKCIGINYGNIIKWRAVTMLFTSYTPKVPTMASETVHYKRGVSQQFSLPAFKIDFAEWKEEDVSTEEVIESIKHGVLTVMLN